MTQPRRKAGTEPRPHRKNSGFDGSFFLPSLQSPPGCAFGTRLLRGRRAGDEGASFCGGGAPHLPILNTEPGWEPATHDFAAAGQRQRRSPKRPPWARLSVLSILTAAALAGCGHGKAADDPASDKGGPLPAVAVAAVTRGSVEKALPATGTLQSLPGKEASIMPAAPGVLDGLYVRYGQDVVKGQVVAHLSAQQALGQIQQAEATLGQNRVQVQQAEANALQQQAQTKASILQAQAAVRNAQAALAGAEATLTGDRAATANARQSLDRAQKLFDDGLVPAKDVEAARLAVSTAQAAEDAQQQAVDGQRQTVAGQAQALEAAKAAALQDAVKRKDVDVARQQVANAEGALRTARAQLALDTLRAPLSGRVTLLGATDGQTVDTSVKIATIADLRTLQLQVNVPPSSASQVHVGQEIDFTVSSLPGRTFATTVRTISPQMDAASGTVPVYAVIDNRSLALKDDLTASVRIVTERHAGALTVPQAAVLTDPDSGATTADVVDGDGVLHVVPVKTGLAADGRVEILDGLKAGQDVAVSGQYGLADGAKVKIDTGSDSGDSKAGGAHGA